MSDYNLGRASGEIIITADTRGAREAQVAMAATAGEAAALDAAMGRVNKTFDENRKVNLSTAESIVKARGEVDQLRRAYQQYQEDYVKGQQRVDEAAQRARDVLRDQRDDLDAVREARVALDRAESDADQLRQQAARSYEAYHDKIQAVRVEVEKFNQAHIGATAGFRNMRNEAEKMGEALESVTEKLSGVARILGQAGLFGLFGGAAGGSLFASGAGALNLLAGALSVVVEAAQDFVGVMALAPAAINGAVLAFGSLAVAFHGVGTALSSIGDPKKFMDSIKDLSPTMKTVLLTVQSFTDAFRGARDAVQESFATQIVQDIQPLIVTWLPQLMNAGKELASEWGKAFHEVFTVFQSSEAQQGFKTFVDNLVTGFQAARGAIQPFLQAWNTLATVGSGVFERIGTALTVVANEFNNWIQRTAQSGQLLDFMNKTLDSLTNIGRTVRDVAVGISNMFDIFRGGGGTTIQTLAQISAEFRSWTESASGQQSLVNFFGLLKTASAAIAPQMHLLGEAIAIVSGTLTRLGIAIQPGLNAFFSSFAESLSRLSPYVIQLAPAINQFLSAFGDTLLQIITTIGPRLPAFFQDMSDAFVQIMQVLPPLADAFAKLMDHLTPTQVEALLGLVGALKLLGATLPVIRAAMIGLDIAMDANPIGLVTIAIGALVAAGILLYENWDKVKEKVGEVTSSFGGMTGILDTIKRMWDSLTSTLGNFWDKLSSGVSGGWDVVLRNVSSFGDSIRNYFTNLWNEATTWGANIAKKLADGLLEGIPGVSEAANLIAGLIPKSMKTNSPAETGPLSQMSPEEMGTRIVTQYAAGMIAGNPAVSNAADTVAGSAAAIGGTGAGGGGGTSFTSGGIAGKSGGDFTKGQSGFDQWVSFITKDLSAWNQIFQEAFGLVNSIGDIVMNTARVAANLIGGGDNALTRPGGLFGPPLPEAQRQVPGVAGKPIRGQAPDKYGRDLAAAQGVDGQQGVPGVPTLDDHGRPVSVPQADIGVPQPTGENNPPASTTGAAAPGSVGAVQPGLGGLPGAQAARRGAGDPRPASPGDSPLATALKARGVPDDQIRVIEGFSQVEGNNPAGNPTLGFTDSQLGGDSGLNAHVDALLKQFHDRESVAGKYPTSGSDADKAQWIARVVGQNGSPSDWEGNAQPKDYVQRVQNAMAGIPVPSAPVAASTTGSVVPSGAAGAPAPATVGQSSDLSGVGIAGAGALTALSGAALTRALQKRAAKGKAIRGEALDAEEAQLAMEPESAAEKISLPAEGAPTDDVLRQALSNYEISPAGAAKINPNLMVDAYHVTDDAGAEGILKNGFQAPASDPNRLAYFSSNPQSAQANQGIYGDRVLAGRIPVSALDQDFISGGLRANQANLAGVNFSELTPDQLQARIAQGVAAPRGQVARAGGSVTGEAPKIPGGPIEPVPGRGPIAGVGRLLGLTGPGLSPDVATVTGTDANGNPLTDRDAQPGLQRTLGFNPSDLLGAPATGQADLDTTPFNAGPRAPGAVTASAPSPAPQPFTPVPYGLPRGTDTGGYGTGNADTFPPWMIALGAKFGVKPSTYSGHQETNRTGANGVGYAPNPQNLNRGVDWVGSREQMQAFAAALLQYGGAEGPGGGLEQVIYQAGPGGQKYGLGGSGNIQDDYYPQSGDGSYDEHGGTDTGAHVHTRFNASIDLGQPTQPPAAATNIQGGGLPGAQAARRGRTAPIGVSNAQPRSITDASWLNVPDNWDLGTPIPTSVRQAHGISDDLPPMYYNARPGTVSNIPVSADYQGSEMVSPGQTVSLPTDTGQATPGFPQTNDQRSPADKISSQFASAASIAGDGFKIFGDVIKDIGAAANMTDTLVRGFANTEDIVGFIQQIQPFLATGADVAKLVGDVGGIVAGAGGADPTGGAGAAGAAVQAISAIVGSAFDAVNQGISLGIDIYHEVGKYAGMLFGSTLGGDNTGPLGGNVRMLLNTKTNQLMTYGEDNPLNKNTFNIPRWQQSYDQQPNTQQQIPSQVNIYTGPGQTPAGMMQESMWMISTGAAPVASVAGAD